jgi:uncharacterized protein (DUF2141 family)
MLQKRWVRSWAVTACGAAMIAAALAASASPKQTQSRLVVRCAGIGRREGILRVSLYNQSEGFPSGGKQFAATEVELSGAAHEKAQDTVTVQFSDLPPGDYAVCAYHDTNSNNNLDLDFFGRPREDWGVSNNPRRSFRPPRFEQASFRLDAEPEKTTVIALRH